MINDLNCSASQEHVRVRDCAAMNEMRALLVLDGRRTETLWMEPELSAGAGHAPPPAPPAYARKPRASGAKALGSTVAQGVCSRARASTEATEAEKASAAVCMLYSSKKREKGPPKYHQPSAAAYI
jgi:hypothetical protein